MTIQTKYGIEYTHYAFRTSKGTFTLVGTSNDTDTFRNLDEPDPNKAFHTWSRKQIHEWVVTGRVEPMPESTHICWYVHGFNAIK